MTDRNTSPAKRKRVEEEVTSERATPHQYVYVVQLYSNYDEDGVCQPLAVFSTEAQARAFVKTIEDSGNQRDHEPGDANSVYDRPTDEVKYRLQRETLTWLPVLDSFWFPRVSVHKTASFHVFF
jgi:hypothetical protein